MCKGLREKYKSQLAMPAGDWDLLSKNAEVARFSSYTIGAIAKKEKRSNKYSAKDLKDDLKNDNEDPDIIKDGKT